MKFEKGAYQYAHQHETIVFKTWPEFWNAVDSKEKTAEVRFMTAAESKRIENKDITAIKLVNTKNGNVLNAKLLWYDKVGSMLGNDVWMFCWDPKDVT